MAYGFLQIKPLKLCLVTTTTNFTDVTAGYRTLYCAELHNLHYNISLTLIQPASKWMHWATL